MSALLKTLNQAQLAAVKQTDLPLLIEAGPGTGKTKTLVAKIYYLLTIKKIPPSKIIALTFTTKAATEIYTRLSTELEPTTLHQFFVGTFHSLAYKKLNLNNSLKIITPQQQLELAQNIIKNFKLKTTPKKLLLKISQIKTNSSIPRGGMLTRATSNFFKDYQAQLEELNLLDFDDLLINYLKSLINQKNRPYLLVDEFQDTNPLQYELIKKILNGSSQLTVIGDPRQAIYGFRNADPKIFQKLATNFKNLKKINLTENYRNGKNIINLSQSLFTNCPQQIAKNSHSGQIIHLHTLNQNTEAKFLGQEIAKLMGGLDLLDSSEINNKKNKYNFKDFAIIYRAHYLNKTLQKEFLQNGIPYQIVGQDHPFKTGTIKKVITELENLVTKNFVYKKTLFELIDELSQKFSIKTETEQLSLLSFKQLSMQFNGKPAQVLKFLKYLECLEQNDFYDENAEKVTLLTMHAAKGLEFKIIFIPAFEKKIIPLDRAEQQNQLAEEKRLFYVALTRAKEKIYLSTAKKRLGQQQTASEFLKFFDQQLIFNKEDQNSLRIIKKIKREQEKNRQLKMF